MQLTGCYMTVEVFATPRARLLGLVPARYQLGVYAGQGKGTLAFWVIACGSIRVGAQPPQRGILSLVGAQIRSPVKPEMPSAPATFDHYLLLAHSDDRALVTALLGVGLPADWVPGIQFSRARVASVAVPWPSGAYELRVHGAGNEAPHDHDNSYWHDGRDGTSQLEIRFYRATDRGCGDCKDSGVLTAPSSPVGRLLGGRPSERPYVAFDHNEIARGEARLFAPLRLAFKPEGRQGYIGLGGTDASGGVLAGEPIPGQPAANAGIRPGDLVLAIDGKPVVSQPGLVTMISARRPGSRVTVTVLRHGVRHNLTVTLGERPG